MLIDKNNRGRDPVAAQLNGFSWKFRIILLLLKAWAMPDRTRRVPDLTFHAADFAFHMV